MAALILNAALATVGAEGCARRAVQEAMSYSWSKNALASAAPIEETVTPVFEMLLPRGRMDVRIRVTPYPNGSLALELQDADGKAFYWPTLPCCPIALAGLLPDDVADQSVVAIKPSAIKNGMAHCLVEAGLLTDLDIEMPVDRYWVRLMKVEFEKARQLAQAAPGAPLVPEPWRLKPLPVPPGWNDTVKRIQQAMRRHGKLVSDADAMLAWAAVSRAISPIPAQLPPAMGAIHEALAGLFEAEETEEELPPPA
ncbi:MAG: hypothetical protein SNJ63_04215 [Sphingomonadaceae bacterium]